MKKKLLIGLCCMILILGIMAIVRYKPFVDKNACVGCADCVKVCPVKAIEVVEEKAEIADSTCVNCRKCIRACNFNAIRVPQ